VRLEHRLTNESLKARGGQTAPRSYFSKPSYKDASAVTSVDVPYHGGGLFRSIGCTSRIVTGADDTTQIRCVTDDPYRVRPRSAGFRKRAFLRTFI
jgi:hypothetical protein